MEVVGEGSLVETFSCCRPSVLLSNRKQLGAIILKKLVVATLFVLILGAPGCSTLGMSAHPGAVVAAGDLTGKAAISPGLQAELNNGGTAAIPINIQVRPAGSLESVDEEMSRTGRTSPLPEAIEAKDLEIAKQEGKPIDDARLAALKAKLKEYAEAGAARAQEIERAVEEHNAQQFKGNSDRLVAEAANITGIHIESTGTEGLITAVATPDAIKRVAALPYVSGILSSRPVPIRG